MSRPDAGRRRRRASSAGSERDLGVPAREAEPVADEAAIPDRPRPAAVTARDRARRAPGARVPRRPRTPPSEALRRGRPRGGRSRCAGRPRRRRSGSSARAPQAPATATNRHRGAARHRTGSGPTTRPAARFERAASARTDAQTAGRSLILRTGRGRRSRPAFGSSSGARRPRSRPADAAAGVAGGEVHGQARDGRDRGSAAPTRLVWRVVTCRSPMTSTRTSI